MRAIKIKAIRSLALGMSLLGAMTLANAENLKIANDTKYNLSFGIENTCSNDFGVIAQRTIQIIPEANLTKACGYNPAYCKVDIYKQEKCTGKSVGSIFIKQNEGIFGVKNIELYFGANGFNLFVSDR